MINYDLSEKFSAKNYIVTSTGNRISRSATITKPQSLEIPSGRVIIKSDVEIVCENAPVIINKYSMIGDGSKLLPCKTLQMSADVPTKYIPMTISNYCYIGKNCKIEAAILGVCCFVGDNSILSSRCILKDYVYIEEGSVVPHDMVIPPFSYVKGNPAKIIGEIPESITTLGAQNAMQRYRSFKQSH